MKKLVLLLAVCVVSGYFSACQKPAVQTNAAVNSNASPTAKRYPFKGKVISVDKAKNSAAISHDAVPEIPMDAMTMDFPIKDTWVMDELGPGAEVTAELVVDKGDFYLEHVGIVAAPNPNQPQPPTAAQLAEKDLVGKDLPDFKLTNQDGKRFNTNEFRGKSLAMTFIYTRCPMPNYCPLMSMHFSELAMNLQKRDDLKDKVRLLSITFDPAHDTPAVLKKYGAGYYNKDVKPDFNIWQFATGSDEDIRKIADFAGLAYQPDATDKTQIIHSLRTLVISPDGKVTKVFAGNEWGTDQLLKALQESLAVN